MCPDLTPFGASERGFLRGLTPPFVSEPMTCFHAFNLGPLSIRFGQGDDFTQIDLAVVTNRNAGLAARETAVRLGWKSEHILALTGQNNPHDTYVTPAGDTVYGKIAISPTGAVSILSAQQVFAEQVLADARRAGLKSAADSAANLQSTAA